MFALLAVTNAVTSTEPALTAIVTSKAGTPSIVANPVRKASRSEAPKLSTVAPARRNEASMGCTVTGVTTMVMTGVISSARRADSSAARACVPTAACRWAKTAARSSRLNSCHSADGGGLGGGGDGGGGDGGGDGEGGEDGGGGGGEGEGEGGGQPPKRHVRHLVQTGLTLFMPTWAKQIESAVL